MPKTSRRSMLAIAGGGGVTAALAAAFRPEPADAQAHDHTPVSGPLATATVSFGSWIADNPGTDRFLAPPPGSRNQHTLTPNEVTVKEGGTVNFIIAGFHLIAIYDDGTQPGQINAGSAQFIDDPVNRIYRGLNPSTQPADRVEAVQFPRRGTYLVICAVRGHFVNDNMYGFVRVLP